MPSNVGREVIEKALELVPPNSHDAGRLQSKYITQLRAEYEEAQEAFQSALSIAQQEKDLNLEMKTLVAAACVDFTNCRFPQSLERNLRAIELAGRVEQPSEEVHARYDLVHVLYAMGDPEEASLHADAISEPAARSGMRRDQSRHVEAKENIASSKGDWQAARDFSEQGLALLPRDPVLLGCRALLEYQTGDFNAGEDYLQRLLSTFGYGQTGTPVLYPHVYAAAYTVPSVVIAVATRITGVMGRFDLVEAVARSLFESPFAHPGPANAARIGLALFAVQRGDAGAAGELYGDLGMIRGTMSPQCPIGPGLAGDRVLGLLAQTTGEPDRAAAHFDDALAFCLKAGYRPELAWTCCDYADTLLERNGEGDREKATALLDESLAISSELGMRPLMERVLSRREILKA